MNEETLGIAGVIGFFLPIIISFIQQSNWKPGAQAVIAFIVCVVAAIIGSFFVDGVDLKNPEWDWIAWFGAIWGSAMLSYSRFWKPTTVSPKIESATNLKKGQQ